MLRPQLVVDGEAPPERAGLNSAFARTLYIVPRAHCRFRVYPLVGSGRPAIAAIKTRAKIDLFSASERRDDQRIELQLITNPVTSEVSVIGYLWPEADLRRSMPETLAQVPQDNGFRLLKQVQGYEGQLWEQGYLRASRWWGSEPSEGDWGVFVRGAAPDSNLADHARPQAQSLAWREDLLFLDTDPDRMLRLASPARLALAGSILAIFFLALSGAQWGSLRAQTALLTQEQAQKSAPAQDVLALRRRALGTLRRVEGMSTAIGSADILSAMAEFEAVIGSAALTALANAPDVSEDADEAGENGANGQNPGASAPPQILPTFSSLGLDGAAFTVTLNNVPDLDISALVKALDARPGLSETDVEPRARGALLIRTTLTPEEIQPQNASAAGDGA